MRLSPQQLLNASIITDVAMRRGLPEQAVIIALATAQQESKLKNLDYGDADSVGLFQQRPSQGWGSAEQILDPVYSAGKFFDALVKVRNWEGLTVAAAAQAVQRSAFPDAYTSWQPLGTALGAALTGLTLTQLTCRLAHPGLELKGKPSSVGSTAASPAVCRRVDGAVCRPADRNLVGRRRVWVDVGARFRLADHRADRRGARDEVGHDHGHRPRASWRCERR